MSGFAADPGPSRNIAAIRGALSEPAGEAKGQRVFRAEDHCHPDLRVWVGDLPPAVIDYAFIAALAKGRAPHFVTHSFRELHPPEATAQKVLDLTLARMDELRLGRQFRKPRHRGNRILSVRNLQRRPSSGALHAHEIVFLQPEECPEGYFESLQRTFAGAIADCMFLPWRCGALRRLVNREDTSTTELGYWTERWRGRLCSQESTQDRLVAWRPVFDRANALGYMRRSNTPDTHSRGWSRFSFESWGDRQSAGPPLHCPATLDATCTSARRRYTPIRRVPLEVAALLSELEQERRNESAQSDAQPPSAQLADIELEGLAVLEDRAPGLLIDPAGHLGPDLDGHLDLGIVKQLEMSDNFVRDGADACRELGNIWADAAIEDGLPFGRNCSGLRRLGGLLACATSPTTGNPCTAANLGVKLPPSKLRLHQPTPSLGANIHHLPRNQPGEALLRNIEPFAERESILLPGDPTHAFGDGLLEDLGGPQPLEIHELRVILHQSAHLNLSISPERNLIKVVAEVCGAKHGRQRGILCHASTCPSCQPVTRLHALRFDGHGVGWLRLHRNEQPCVGLGNSRLDCIFGLRESGLNLRGLMCVEIELLPICVDRLPCQCLTNGVLQISDSIPVGCDENERILISARATAAVPQILIGLCQRRAIGCVRLLVGRARMKHDQPCLSLVRNIPRGHRGGIHLRKVTPCRLLGAQSVEDLILDLIRRELGRPILG
jgi:hypothetical protein